MLGLKVLSICVCLVAGAPSKERSYEYRSADDTVFKDTFRPKFPNINLRKDTSDGGELILLKMSDSLVPVSDSTTLQNGPEASRDQKQDDLTSPQRNYYSGDESTAIQNPMRDIARDIIEKPVVEKTIFKQCECEKSLEEKHIDEPLEVASAENTPVESKYAVKPNSGGFDSKKDPYDIPINPEFGLAPSDDRDSSNPVTKDGPSILSFEMSPKPSETVDEKPSVGAKTDSEQSDHYESEFPNVSESDTALTAEQSVSASETPLASEYPVQTADNSHEVKEDVFPNQKDDGMLTMVNHPEETRDINDGQYPKAPVPLSDDAQKEQESVVYPQHPIDGHKIPIEAVPLGPKAEEPVVMETFPGNNEPETLIPVDAAMLPDSQHINLGTEQDTKPDILEETDVVPQIPPEAVGVPQEPVGTDGESKVPTDVLETIPNISGEDPIIDPLSGSIPAKTPVITSVVTPQLDSAESPFDPENKPVNIAPTISTVCEDMGLRKFMYLMNKAGYKDMLTRKRPLTIFVPSDEAWNLLPLPVLNRMQRDRNFLRRVLRYHIADEIMESEQIRKGYYCPSMQQGAGLFVNTYGKNMYVNGVPALPSPTKPTNGAVYVLSRVMYPFPNNNLAEAIQTTGTFTRFYTLAAESGILDRELSETGPYTLFAPTDEAFGKLPLKTIEWLSWDREALRSLLLKHLVSGTYYSTFVPESEGGHLTSLSGEDIDFRQSDKKDEFYVNDAHLCDHDITTKNGVLHGVDEVLFAKDLKPKPFVRPVLKSVYG